jgi:hypothetical protein
MDEGQLKERGNALEEEFFRKQNAAIVSKLRAAKEAEAERAEMAAAVGVDDPELVAQLQAHGVTSASLAALSLAPLVLVAWADRNLDSNERKAVLEEAAKVGIAGGTPEHELLTGWLNERPASGLLDNWAAYARGVVESLDGVRRTEFRDSILARARAVANAAGGFAGLNKVSTEEKSVLEAIEAALAD